jgi:hypothetical protein
VDTEKVKKKKKKTFSWLQTNKQKTIPSKMKFPQILSSANTDSPINNYVIK